MTRRRAALAACLLLAFTWLPTALCAQVRVVLSPEQFLGHRVGADYKLAKWAKITAYFRKVAELSDRVKIEDIGPSTLGRSMILATIAAPQPLRELDRHRAAQHKLADPRLIKDKEERKQLIESSKIVILISCGIHASETAASQMAMELLHYLVTSQSPEV